MSSGTRGGNKRRRNKKAPKATTDSRTTENYTDMQLTSIYTELIYACKNNTALNTHTHTHATHQRFPGKYKRLLNAPLHIREARHPHHPPSPTPTPESLSTSCRNCSEAKCIMGNTPNNVTLEQPWMGWTDSWLKPVWNVPELTPQWADIRARVWIHHPERVQVPASSSR